MTDLKLNPSDIGPWLRVKDAAELKGVTVVTLNGWIRQGHIDDRYIDRARGVTRIRRGALDAYIGHRTDPRFATGELLKIDHLCDMLDASRAMVVKWIEEFHAPIHFAPNGRDRYMFAADAETLCEQVQDKRTHLDLDGMTIGSRTLEGPGGEEIIKNVASAIQSGFTLGPAATTAGVAPSSLASWVKEGRQRLAHGIEKSDPFIQLIMAIDEAMAMSEGRMIQMMEKAGAGDWKQWQYRLQKQHKEGAWEEKNSSSPTVNVNQTQQVEQKVSNETKTLVVASPQITAQELLAQSPELFDAMSQIAEGMENAINPEGSMEDRPGQLRSAPDKGREADASLREEASPNDAGESVS